MTMKTKNDPAETEQFFRDLLAGQVNNSIAETTKTESMKQAVLAVLFFCIPALTVSTILWQWL